MEPMFTREELYSSMGHMRTRSIFMEVNTKEEKPILSLRRGSHRGYPSLYDLYVSLCVDDPSEVVFAETVFGDLAYWEAIKKQKWFDNYYKEYVHVCDTKRKSLAFQAIIEEPWKQKRTAKAKEAVKESTEAAFVSDEVSEDLERLRESGLLN